MKDLPITTLVEQGHGHLEIQSQAKSLYLAPSDRYLMTLRSQNSRRTMKSILNNIVRILGGTRHNTFDWLSVEPTHIDVVIEYLATQKELKPRTINLYINAMRGVFKAAYRNSQISIEAYKKLSDISFFKASRLTKGREPLSRELVSALLNTCDGSALGVRDAAIISLLANCGLRRDEVVNLTIDQYNRENRKLNVIGKGNKERVMPVPLATAQRLEIWIDNIRGLQSGYIFCRVRRWDVVGNSFNIPMTGQSIYDIVSKRAKLISDITVKPHALRRFFGTSLLKKGYDMVLTRDLLGHTDIKTTQVYIDSTDEEMRRAAEDVAV